MKKALSLIALLVLALPCWATSYYISPSGSDAANGTSTGTPWLSPNHALNCGDVIQAAAGTYSRDNFQTGKWGVVTCVAANNVAWLKCAVFDTCYIADYTGYVLGSMYVDKSYWGVQGWEITNGTAAYDACFGAFPNSASPVEIHHIIFANNIANGCSQGAFVSANNGTASIDYLAIIGNIGYNASQASTNCASGISVYQPVVSDPLPGTHIYIAGNFMWHNVDGNPCAGGSPMDGEGITLDTEWFYQRVWVETLISAQSTTATQERRAWYPALGLQRAGQPDSIAGEPIMWDSPIYHRKSGSVGKWRYGCPRIYPMLDWAKESRKYLESCASLRQSLAQIALKITTKGGQQALQGLKQQFQTTVGPAANIWDQNPPTNAAVFGSGPGTEIEAFKTQGSGLDPEGVRQYKLMCCMVKGVPETFIGDVSTGNLATATSLDRPTETVMLELQEEWAEDLAVLCGYALAVSDRATGGKLRAALAKQGVDAGAVEIREAARRYKPNGLWVHEYPKKSKKAEIKIRVNFPAIREGDVPQLTAAIVQAMTLGNKGGQVTGIDEREGCRQLFRVLGIEDGDALIEEMYPEKEYDPDRTTEELPPPVPKAQPSPAGATPGAPEGPTQPGEQGDAAPPAQQPKEAMRAAARRLTKALQLLEAESHAND